MVLQYSDSDKLLLKSQILIWIYLLHSEYLNAVKPVVMRNHNNINIIESQILIRRYLSFIEHLYTVKPILKGHLTDLKSLPSLQGLKHGADTTMFRVNIPYIKSLPSLQGLKHGADRTQISQISGYNMATCISHIISHVSCHFKQLQNVIVSPPDRYRVFQ